MIKIIETSINSVVKNKIKIALFVGVILFNGLLAMIVERIY